MSDRPAVVIQASAPQTVNGQSGGIPVPVGSSSVAVQVNVTAASGTTPSMTLTVQWSNDGTTWGSADGTPDTMTAITAATVVSKSFPVRGGFMRLSWAITGTTPSFTFAATVYGI